jgi:hypothetical protein
MFESFVKTQWYSAVAIAGGFLFFYAFISETVYFDRNATAFLGIALFLFGCAQNTCWILQTTIIDASQTPAGVGSLKGQGFIHRVNFWGAVLYALATISLLISGKLFFF